MKHKIVTFRILSTLAFSMVALSATAFDTNDFLVHMGADLQGRHVSMQENFGGNLVQKDYAQMGAYAGMRFFEDSLGFEVGFGRSNSMSRNRDIAVPASYFGSQPPAGTYISQTKVAMQNSYAAVVGLVPLSHIHRLKLMASLGAGRTRAKIGASLNPNPPAGGTLWPLRFMAIKWIPKASMGLQWMATEHLGLRALAGWEQMGRFKRVRATNGDGSANNTYFASFKNATSATLGVFYSF